MGDQAAERSIGEPDLLLTQFRWVQLKSFLCHVLGLLVERQARRVVGDDRGPRVKFQRSQPILVGHPIVLIPGMHRVAPVIFTQQPSPTTGPRFTIVSRLIMVGQVVKSWSVKYFRKRLAVISAVKRVGGGIMT